MLKPTTSHLCDAEQFYFIAHIRGLIDVVDSDRPDSFEHNRVEIDLRAKGDGGQQRQFMARVDAADVKFWICLEETKLVGGVKDLFVGHAVVFHAG